MHSLLLFLLNGACPKSQQAVISRHAHLHIGVFKLNYISTRA